MDNFRGVGGFAVSADDAEMQALVQAAVQAAMAAVAQARRGPHAAPAEPLRQVTFAELWASYRMHGEIRIDSWNYNQKSHEKKILPFWGPLPWHECTPEAEDRFRAKLRAFITKRGTPTSAGFRNRIMNSVKACLEWNARRRPAAIPYNPLRGSKEEAVPTTRDFHVNDEQFLVLLASAPPLLKLMLVLLFETGCRRDEIRLLDWAEVDTETRAINLPAERTKTREARTVTLSDRAWQALQLVPRMPGTRFVFVNPRDGGPIPKSTLGRWFRASRERAGIKGPRGQNVWLHTLRHSWASLQAGSGLPIPKLMSMGGWKDPKVAAKYVNMSPEQREEIRSHMNRRRPGQVEELAELLKSGPDDEAGEDDSDDEDD